MIRTMLIKLRLWMIEDDIAMYEEGRRRLQSLYEERAHLQRTLWALNQDWL